MTGTTPKKVLYVHHRPELGGAPSSLAHLLEALDRRRFEPHVYCPGGPAAQLFERAGATVHAGPVASFTHIWASVYRGRRWLLLGRELRSLPGHVHDFNRLLDKHDFAVVHLNDSPLIPAAAMAHRRSVPVVWHLRSAIGNGGRGLRSRLVRRSIRGLANASIAINDNVAASFGGASLVVANTVDLERFAPGDPVAARAAAGLPADRPVISFFGFIYPFKGYRDFIDAAALLRRRGVEATFVIVGSGVRGDAFFATIRGRALKAFGLVANHERDARRMVARLGLAERVRFVRFTEDTPLIYRASDAVIAPSRGPELGRPVLEAAACGRPVIATGSRDGAGVVIQDRTGLLVPRRSPDTMASAIAHLLEDPARCERMGVRARAHAERYFDAQRNAARVMELYDRLPGRD